jgi:hypothetical protein
MSLRMSYLFSCNLRYYIKGYTATSCEQKIIIILIKKGFKRIKKENPAALARHRAGRNVFKD